MPNSSWPRPSATWRRRVYNTIVNQLKLKAAVGKLAEADLARRQHPAQGRRAVTRSSSRLAAAWWLIAVLAVRGRNGMQPAKSCDPFTA